MKLIKGVYELQDAGQGLGRERIKDYGWNE